MTALLSLLFFVMFFLLMFYSFTEKSIETAKKKIDIVFLLEKKIPEHKITFIKDQLSLMEKNGAIQSFRYISAEEALKVFAKQYPQRYIYWKRTTSKELPVAPAIEIIPQNKSIENLTRLFLSDAYIGIINKEKINITKDDLIQSNKSLELLFFLQKGIWILVLVILLSIAGITATFISSSFFLRQKEIFIMRLVGASQSYIRTPFLVEGVIIVSVSLLIGWSVFFFARSLVFQKLLTLFSSPKTQQEVAENINQMWIHFQKLLPETIGIILILAFITSYISIQQSLRNKNILGK